MARLDEPAAAEKQWPRLYEPETETDPLLRKYVTLPPLSSGKNDPVIKGLDGGHYPIWAIILNYRAVRGDMGLLMRNYGGSLTREQLEAAIRFVELYPDEVLPYVEEIERAG